MVLIEHPIQLIALLLVLSLLPLFVVMGTSFLKLAVVFALLRSALGTQQLPPSIAIYGLALVLTTYIMAPVILETRDKLRTQTLYLSVDKIWQIAESEALSPYRNFLRRHTGPGTLKFFASISQKTWPEKYQRESLHESMLIMIPAFTISQLTEAFEIGLLLYLPFIAIDLLVSNVLLSMGMMMVSPFTIALPFKLLLFVVINGWQVLLNQLVLSYS